MRPTCALFLWVLLLLQTGCYRDHLEKVLTDTYVHGPFVAVKIKGPAGAQHVVIRNWQLFSVLSETRGWNEERYAAALRTALEAGGAFPVSGAEQEALQDDVVPGAKLRAAATVQDFRAEASGSVLDLPENTSERKAIIHALFQERKYVCTDDETGYFISCYGEAAI